MSRSREAKEQRVVISGSSIRDWQGVLVELEQSLKACNLAMDLLGNITSSLQVSVQCLQEQVSQDSTRQEYL